MNKSILQLCSLHYMYTSVNHFNLKKKTKRQTIMLTINSLDLFSLKRWQIDIDGYISQSAEWI